jgi:type I restriction enzyme S subunit
MSNKAKTVADEEGVKVALTPRMRFPEFRDAVGWPLKRFEEYAAISKGEQLSASEKDIDALYPHFNGGMVPSSYTHKNNRSANTIIISEGGNSCGFVQFVTVPFWCGGHCYAVTPNSLIVTECLYYALQSKQLQIMALRVGSGLPNIQKSTLEKFPLALPATRSEQQQIADCLSSADELIAAQGRKVDALKAHKKGLMERLFPPKGETQPRFRFPEFRDAKEWSSDALGNIFETSSGGTPDRTKGEYWNGTIPWVTTSLIAFNVITTADEYISDSGLQNSSAKIFPKRTVLMAMYGQGKTRGQVALLGIEAATNQACAAILPRDDIDPRFVFLNLGGRYEELRSLSNSGGQENLSQGLIKGLRFSYPKDSEEQKAIGDCFTFLDDLITAQIEKLDAIKSHKKGLMQKLFPSMDEAL